jgi:hypothetical protein
MVATDFHLVDLVSQREAVRRVLNGKSEKDVLAWLSERGRVTPIPSRVGPTSFEFESATGQRAQFFFSKGDMAFVADHTTFT